MGAKEARAEARAEELKTPKRNSQDAQVEEARAEARAEELKLQ